MSPQPVPPLGSSRPDRIGRAADAGDAEGHGLPEAQPDASTDAQVAPRRVVVDADEDDVEGHGLGLNLALAGAVVLGTAATGASVSVASTLLAPGASSVSAATPTPTPSPSPAAPDPAVTADTVAATDATSSGDADGRIHTGVYITPVRTTSVDIELA